MLTNHRSNRIHPYLSSLLCKPLAAVDVLCRTHGHGQTIRVCVPTFNAGDNLGLNRLGTIVDYAAAHQRTLAVYNAEFISVPMPKNPDTMTGFLLIKTDNAAIYVT